MMIRVKLVISMTNAGMKLSAVMISKICRLTEYSCCPWASVDRVMAGIDNGLLPVWISELPAGGLGERQRSGEAQHQHQQQTQHQDLSF